MTLKVGGVGSSAICPTSMERVTDADFVMVALDKDGKPKPVPEEKWFSAWAYGQEFDALVPALWRTPLGVVEQSSNTSSNCRCCLHSRQ